MGEAIKIGITGQSGFIGTHLFNYLGLKTNIVRIPFLDEYFNNKFKLQEFVKSCDAIVHFAALNRHYDPCVIYKTNIDLVKKLISACEQTNSRPHVLFSSSTQEENDNPYGKSKYDGRKLFEDWAFNNNAQFTGLVLPNVFGPFGNPYYNSFIATFCHQLTHNEQSEIQVDSKVPLIYVSELVKEFLNQIIKFNNTDENLPRINKVHVSSTSQYKVSEVLTLLERYKENYFSKGTIPELTNTFELNLFNTFVCYINHKQFFPYSLIKQSDARGTFIEIIKINSGGQVSFSTTKPGITRGNHFHTRKAERFAVIKGNAKIAIRRVGTPDIFTFVLNGNNPSFVDMPIWYTHNITNVGDDELFTIFWINESFNPDDSDTYFEEV
ncbi:MAG: SDR family oxidoreductase [Mariniphaga sp.]|nr:SDR family oxidoreductase [Mariniphaga sp.]